MQGQRADAREWEMCGIRMCDVNIQRINSKVKKGGLLPTQADFIVAECSVEYSVTGWRLRCHGRHTVIVGFLSSHFQL